MTKSWHAPPSDRPRTAVELRKPGPSLNTWAGGETTCMASTARLGTVTRVVSGPAGRSHRATPGDQPWLSCAGSSRNGLHPATAGDEIPGVSTHAVGRPAVVHLTYHLYRVALAQPSENGARARLLLHGQRAVGAVDVVGPRYVASPVGVGYAGHGPPG